MAVGLFAGAIGTGLRSTFHPMGRYIAGGAIGGAAGYLGSTSNIDSVSYQSALEGALLGIGAVGGASFLTRGGIAATLARGARGIGKLMRSTAVGGYKQSGMFGRIATNPGTIAGAAGAMLYPMISDISDAFPETSGPLSSARINAAMTNTAISRDPRNLLGPGVSIQPHQMTTQQQVQYSKTLLAQSARGLTMGLHSLRRGEGQ